jgi:diacylglycerol kinase family enzyme
MAAVPQDTIVRVYAVGGDGILFDCLNGIIGFENVELAIVPYGLINNFLKAFGDDIKYLFRDIKSQISSPTVPTDVLCTGGNYALNFCIIGVEADANMKTLQIKHTLGHLGFLFRWLYYRLHKSMYYLGGFFAILNEKIMRQRYEVTIDGEDCSGNYQSIYIANGSCYWGNKHPINTAVPNDGIFDVLMGRNVGVLRSFRNLIPYTKGQYYKYPSTFIWKRGRKITVRSDSPLMVTLDGEVFMNTDISVELIPHAVKIVAVTGLKYIRRAEPYEYKR